MSETPDSIDEQTVARYLERIDTAAPAALDLTSLTTLVGAHLVAVPFENLDVFHQRPVQTSLDWSIPKIIDRRRGGWCFEVNGALGALLCSLGFEVRYLAAAVLLDGPNTAIDHVCLEVRLDQPYLVDVGFGDDFFCPLELDSGAEQDGGNGVFQLIDSSIGTTLARIVDGVSEPRYRFTSVSRQLSDFNPASAGLAGDADGNFRSGPLVTRLLDPAGSRVTLSSRRLTVKEPDGSERSVVNVAPDAWWSRAAEWFGESFGPELMNVSPAIPS